MKKYKILLIDPPWAYKNKNTGGSMKSGSSAKYQTMELEEIKALPIPYIADKDSVLFLWCTTPLLEYGFEVMRAWGFKYKTAIYWRKIMSLGLGYYFRGQVEVLLMGIKGKIKAFRIQKLNFIQTKVLRHSEKPEEFRKLIEETKLEPRVEIFARKQVEGWDCYGMDIDGKDVRKVLVEDLICH